MHPLARYGLSLLVALGVTALVLGLSDEHSPIVVASIALLYGASTALVESHRDVWYRSARGENDASSRKVSALGGGISAFVGTALLQVSLAVSVAGFGMLVFGMAIAITEFPE